jgi:hypothetical protein
MSVKFYILSFEIGQKHMYIKITLIISYKIKTTQKKKKIDMLVYPSTWETLVQNLPEVLLVNCFSDAMIFHNVHLS